MTTNDSLQFFLRLIKEKHQRVRESGEILLKALAGEDPEKKKSAAAEMLKAGADLKAVLSNNDIPSWLSNNQNQLSLYVGGSWTSPDFLINFIPIKASLDNHRWVFDESSEKHFDFDSIFEHFKKESRLPELFDEIVRLLEEIQDSGEVDSVSMLRALGKVIATIKRCKDGSYFSLNGAWEFLLSFLNNYLWGELSKLPVLGAALEALGKTINETNEEMHKLHGQLKKEMSRVVEGDLKVLANRSEFPFVTYNKAGHLLAGKSTPQLPDETA